MERDIAGNQPRKTKFSWRLSFFLLCGMVGSSTLYMYVTDRQKEQVDIMQTAIDQWEREMAGVSILSKSRKRSGYVAKYQFGGRTPEEVFNNFCNYFMRLQKWHEKKKSIYDTYDTCKKPYKNDGSIAKFCFENKTRISLYLLTDSKTREPTFFEIKGFFKLDAPARFCVADV